MQLPPSTPTLFPYTTLFRSYPVRAGAARAPGTSLPTRVGRKVLHWTLPVYSALAILYLIFRPTRVGSERSEEHTSEPSHRCISYAVFCLKKKINSTSYTMSV